jgi:hypothetical protein
MKISSCLIIAFLLGLVTIWQPPLASAKPQTPSPQITFDSFTGIYHLSRDSKGLSLLSSEETIVADFPGNGSFYGITRSLPKKYQNRSVNIKVLNVSDAAGNVVPYKTATDNNNNLIVTTGDPSITLYGSQTIKIRYQTSGVVNLKQKTDEFLLNVNGRGWDQPFASVNATLYIPASFKANLVADPVCYKALNNLNSKDCQINTKKSSKETIVTSAAKQLAAHQALVVKANFKPATFTGSHGISKSLLAALGAVLVFVLALLSYALKKRT